MIQLKTVDLCLLIYTGVSFSQVISDIQPQYIYWIAHSPTTALLMYVCYRALVSPTQEDSQ
jgi:hypothetical protein